MCSRDSANDSECLRQLRIQVVPKLADGTLVALKVGRTSKTTPQAAVLPPRTDEEVETVCRLRIDDVARPSELM